MDSKAGQVSSPEKDKSKLTAAQRRAEALRANLKRRKIKTQKKIINGSDNEKNS